ncbi:hypothetical protein GUJ93_ZPchr0002g26166 [Zizania palustris]|uniref:Uncharacterized protein n=1 Tax=Zizania palustris TaxID=103762 RepID=A0A8J5S5R5_ZIZPA|nr:hypothetical protein GUJ93_ZPchr0002g26166 [Zizania palustris]
MVDRRLCGWLVWLTASSPLPRHRSRSELGGDKAGDRGTSVGGRGNDNGDGVGGYGLSGSISDVGITNG